MPNINIPTGDFITTTLNGAISNSATGATIGTGLNIPATNGVLQVDYDSVIPVGTASGPETWFYSAYNTLTGAVSGITRGYASTTGVTHNNGASVQAGMSVAYLLSTIQSIIQGSAWTSYTPVLTGPSLGNGSLDASYMLLGKTAFLRIAIVWGSTSTFGGATSWQLSLPFTTVTSTVGQAINGGAFDSSANTYYPAVTRIDQASAITTRTGSDTTPFTATSPFTWATSDIFWIEGILEVA